MTRKQTAFMSPRRIAVTGAIPWDGSDLAQHFCGAIGEAIVEHRAIVVTRGGMASSRPRARKNLLRPIDEFVVRGAKAMTTTLGIATEDAIDTIVGEGRDGRELFQVGKLRSIRGRSYEAERFRFVDLVDGVIGICGRGGTRQSLILGLATDRPILPVPAFGGGSLEVCNDHQHDVATRLGIDVADAKRWQQTPKDEPAATALARHMVGRLLGAMVRRCFIVMPFHHAHSALYDFVIAPAVEGLGDEPIRLDRMAVPGDVGQQIATGIQLADYVIVVLDGMRPNVLYELGLAHGQGKPTILLNQSGSLGSDADAMPFDLALQQRLEYAAVDATLPTRLQEAIQKVFRRRRASD